MLDTFWQNSLTAPLLLSEKSQSWKRPAAGLPLFNFFGLYQSIPINQARTKPSIYMHLSIQSGWRKKGHVWKEKTYMYVRKAANARRNFFKTLDEIIARLSTEQQELCCLWLLLWYYFGPLRRRCPIFWSGVPPLTVRCRGSSIQWSIWHPASNLGDHSTGGLA